MAQGPRNDADRERYAEWLANLQVDSDDLCGGRDRREWNHTPFSSRVPTRVYEPRLSRSSGCRAQIWIANMDSVLTDGWLALIKAIGRPRNHTYIV